MGLFSSFVDFCSSVARDIGSAVSSAWAKTKEIAGKALDWMAEKAETLVNGVKNVWQAVKPYISRIRASLRAAASSATIPWIAAVLKGLEVGLGALEEFDNSPIASKIDDAITWVIQIAKRRQNSRQVKTGNEAEEILSEEELVAARRHQENLRFAEREIVAPEKRHHLELASAINDYEIVRSDLALVIDSSPENFEHYLRLRATQKLLSMADQKFRSAQSIEELSSDDIFLVRIASDLIKASPELSTEAADRLDRILTEKYGKKLTPFVFEELIASWGVRAKELEEQWTVDNGKYAENQVLLMRLQLAKNVQNELSNEDSFILDKLKIDVPIMQQQLDILDAKKRGIELYVGAAEGFLQLLEKTEEQILKEDRSYLLEDGEEVGKLLINCAQQDISFDALSEHDQSLIVGYSNVFRNEAQKRMKKVLEIAA